MKFSLADHFGATVRSLTSATRDGKQVRILHANRVFKAPIDDVWDALTSKDRIHRWMLTINGDLHVGGRFQFEGNAGGEVLVCDAPNHLSVTWEFGDSLTWVDVFLQPLDDDTLLLLEHSAPIEDLTSPHYQQFGPGAVGIGWEMSLMGLGEHLANPDIVVREGDVASMDLSGYMRDSSNAWRDAAIAAGEDPTTATAAAERCLQAYVG
jgi:uncharacterized protein YndB with AHSA1/START domain